MKSVPPIAWELQQVLTTSKSCQANMALTTMRDRGAICKLRTGRSRAEVRAGTPTLSMSNAAQFGHVVQAKTFDCWDLKRAPVRSILLRSVREAIETIQVVLQVFLH